MELTCLPIPNNLLKDCQVFNSRNEIIDQLNDKLIIAEIGVLGGDFSEILLKKAQRLYLIDLYNANDWSWSNRFTSSQHWEFMNQRFRHQTNVKLLRGNSYTV